MSEERVKSSGEAFDRLTQLTELMRLPLDMPENADVKGIIFLRDEDRGGIQVFGYDADSIAALADLFIHIRAIFEANGKKFLILTDEGLFT